MRDKLQKQKGWMHKNFIKNESLSTLQMLVPFYLKLLELQTSTRIIIIISQPKIIENYKVTPKLLLFT